MPNTNNFNLNLNDVFDLVYPIGTLYSTQDETFNPNNSFVGVWEQVKDRFILACGDTYKIGQTGGNADAIVVSHRHIVMDGHNNVPVAGPYTIGGGTTYMKMNCVDITNDKYLVTNEVGLDGEGANMPPYETAYIWKRIS